MKRTGFTLVELLVVVAIVAILGLLSPSLSSVLARNRGDASIKYLYSHLQFARSTAVGNNRRITLCGSADRAHCSRRWEGGEVIVFHDRNNNKTRDADEQLLRSSPVPHGVFYWRGANRDYLRYRPDGSVIEFGTFSWCPANRNADEARQVTINHAGRAYRSRDRNGDGVHEANRGSGPIVCPA